MSVAQFHTTSNDIMIVGQQNTAISSSARTENRLTEEMNCIEWNKLHKYRHNETRKLSSQLRYHLNLCTEASPLGHFSFYDYQKLVLSTREVSRPAREVPGSNQQMWSEVGGLLSGCAEEVRSDLH